MNMKKASVMDFFIPGTENIEIEFKMLALVPQRTPDSFNYAVS